MMQPEYLDHRAYRGARVTNGRVPYSWKRGQPAHNSRGSLHTDGYSLYSYGLKIGLTDETGRKILLEYTRNGHFVSMTTSCHVGSARGAADVVRIP